MVNLAKHRKFKNKEPHAFSVRKEGEIVEIRIYRCQGGREETFRGKARMSSEKELKRLFSTAVNKGLNIPEYSQESLWFK